MRAHMKKIPPQSRPFSSFEKKLRMRRYSYVHMKPLLGLFMKGNGLFSKWCDAV